MKTNIQKYPAYKDSGVEWLGEIPNHWKSERLASILNNVAERNRTDLPLLSITREKGVILRDMDNEEENHNFIPDDLSNYKVLRKGQFGMNKMKAWQGSYGISEQDGIVSPAYFIFQLREDIDSRYFHLAIRSRLYISFFGSASDGVRIGQWDLSRDRMKNIQFLIPPLPEQTTIAAFLDRKTTLIDQAIDIKQKQIELLKERRQILIHKAVTRGLNPNVKMKDSGVEWIGEIPEGWEVRSNKNIFKLKKQQVGKKSGDYLLLSLTLNGVIKRDMENPQGKFPAEFDTYQEVKKGDFIFCLFDVEETPRCVGLSDFEGMITGAYTVMESIEIFDKNFLYYYFIDIDERKRLKYLYTGLRNTITKNNFFSLKIATPSFLEQKEISCAIQKIENKIATAISLKEQEIEKLKEYKATLINSAVTGKIKVC